MTHILICNHQVGAPTLHLEWARIINYTKVVDNHPKKLSVEMVSVILLRAKMENAKSSKTLPVTSKKLNTHLQNHHKKEKCNKNQKQVMLSQQSQFQLRNNEKLAKLFN